MASIAAVSLYSHWNPNHDPNLNTDPIEAYIGKAAKKTGTKRRDHRKLKHKRSNKRPLTTVRDDNSIEPSKAAAPVAPPKEDKEPNKKIYAISVLPVSMNKKLWEPILVDVDVVGRERILVGDPLAEIFSVCIADLGGKSSRKLHGQIELRGSLDVENLFFCNKENALTVEAKGSIQLRGPMLPIVAYDPYCVRFHLKEGDKSWCEGNIWWSPYHYTLYDKPLIKTIKGPIGSVEITYITFKDAVIAELEVKILTIKNSVAVARICGSISASIQGMDLASVMFSNEENKCLIRRPQDIIPMSKPSLCVPRASALVVTANLWDSSFSPKRPLAQGARQFPPGYCGDYISTIEGDCGIIQVTVTWFSVQSHPPTTAATFPLLS